MNTTRSDLAGIGDPCGQPTAQERSGLAGAARVGAASGVARERQPHQPLPDLAAARDSEYTDGEIQVKMHKRWERLTELAVVIVAHLGVLGWIILSPATPAPMLTVPTIQGVMIAPEQPAPPQPAPAAPEVVEPEPEPPPPKPVPTPKPKPKPIPKPKPVPTAKPVPPVEAPPPSEPVVARPSRAPGPPVAAPPPAPFVPPRSDAAHLNNPAPPYPSMSRRLDEEGRVLLDVYILADGSVGQIRLRASSSYARLDQAALKAVRHWRYVPARRGDQPIAYWYVQPIVFSLSR